MKKTTLITLILLIIFGKTTHYIQQTQVLNFPDNSITEDFKYLPSGAFLKGAALSFDEALADLFWIKSIGYFGERSSKGKDFQWLPQLLDVTTSLDPFFEDPYEFGGIILGYELKDVEGSINILKKGMENVPTHHERYWYLPFFTAFNYMYYKGDYKTAADYLKIAASFPQSPKYLPLLVSRLYANTEDPGIAIPFLSHMLERASTPQMKEDFKRRIKEILIKQHILLLTTAQESFTKSRGTPPKSLEELVLHGFINKLPEEPFGGKYYISKDKNKTIRTSTVVDNMELHIRQGPGLQLIYKEKK